MGCELHPIVFYHVSQCLIATQSSHSSLSRYILYVISSHILHSINLKSSILKPKISKFSIDLPNQKFSFEDLEREIVEPCKREVSTNEPRIFVGPEIFSQCFAKCPSHYFIHESWYIESEQINDFINGLSASYKISASHKLEYSYQFVWIKFIKV